MSKKINRFDVIVIGAGTAGLSALNEVLKHTDNAMLVNNGPLGTTCVRTACMPSKAFIHAARLFDSQQEMRDAGIRCSEKLKADIPRILEVVREKRSYFLQHIHDDMQRLMPHIIEGKAVFETEQSLRINQKRYHAKSIVIATGSNPFIPESFKPFHEHIITTDTLFERQDLPHRIAVVGLGAVGLEMAQAFAKLGLEVTAINKEDSVGVVQDETIRQTILDALGVDMTLWLDCEPEITESSDGISLRCGDRKTEVDAIFLATGRKPNLRALGLEKIGISCNSEGVPRFNHHTMQLPGKPIYIAGDATDERAILHEANDEGKRAGFHAIFGDTKVCQRYPNMQIIFTHPSIAVVGENQYGLRHEDAVIGESSYDEQGRAVLEGNNFGKIRIFADQEGIFRGAEIMSPAAEHLAHFLALALSQQLRVKDMLKSPFYHPTFEEGLRTALASTQKQLEGVLK